MNELKGNAMNALGVVHNVLEQNCFTNEERIKLSAVLETYSTTSFWIYCPTLNEKNKDVIESVKIIAKIFADNPNIKRNEKAAFVILKGAIITEKKRKKNCSQKEALFLDNIEMLLSKYYITKKNAPSQNVLGEF